MKIKFLLFFMIIWEILKDSIDRKASDIIIISDALPYLKIDWEMVLLEQYWVISKEIMESEIFSIMSEKQKIEFREKLEIDFSIDLKGHSRFRVNAFNHKKWFWVVFRIIRNELPSFEELMIPPSVLNLVERKSGLILITGAVGTGKSTTMSVLIDYINKNDKKHIITIEDPIEFMFTNDKSLIEQREVWINTHSFENGLKYALRQASDVIMVGEMRDLETFRLALRAAETGNLVLATLHTSWAARTISRIIDMFPSEEKEQVMQQLSESLIAVIWQDLLKRKDKEGRVPWVEILINNTNVANIIRRGQTHQLNNAIETGKASGMITMKKSLEFLVSKEYIYEDDYDNYLKYLWRLDESL
jgi:twitching motility protein PilT